MSETRRPSTLDQDGLALLPETEAVSHVTTPRMFRVLLHNDDYTTRDFVVHVLQSIFHHPEPRAVEVMLHVHQQGVGVAGIYTREIAESKIARVEQMADEEEFPLRLSMEPETVPAGDGHHA